MIYSRIFDYFILKYTDFKTSKENQIMDSVKMNAIQASPNNPVFASAYFDGTYDPTQGTVYRTGDVLSNLLDDFTGEEMQFKMIDNSIGVTPDGVIYFEKDGEVFKRVFAGPANVKWFGALGDGISDDTAALLKMANANLSDVYLPEGLYTCKESLDLGKTNIQGAGSNVTKIVFNRPSAQEVKSYGCINFHGGEFISLPALGADILNNKREIIFAAPITLNAGDVILIYDEEDFSYSGYRPYYKQGEFFSILRIEEGNKIVLHNYPYENYNKDKTSLKLFKLANVSVGGVTDVTIENNNFARYGFCVINAANAIFQNIKVITSNSNNYSLIPDDALFCIMRSFNITLSSIIATNIQETNPTNYGGLISNSQNIIATSLNMVARRSGFETSGRNQLGDVPNRNIRVSSSILTAYEGYGVSFHGNTEYSGVDNCKINGAVLRGSENFLSNSTITNTHLGTCVYLGEQRSAGATIQNNKFYNHIESPTGRGHFIETGTQDEQLNEHTTYGGVIRIESNDMISYCSNLNSIDAIIINNRNSQAKDIDVIIRNNSILGANHAEPFKYRGITVQSLETLNAMVLRDVYIENNIFDGGINLIGIRNTYVRNNSFRKGYRYGIYLRTTTRVEYEASYVELIGNTLDYFGFGGINMAGLLTKTFEELYLENNKIYQTNFRQADNVVNRSIYLNKIRNVHIFKNRTDHSGSYQDGIIQLVLCENVQHAYNVFNGIGSVDGLNSFNNVSSIPDYSSHGNYYNVNDNADFNNLLSTTALVSAAALNAPPVVSGVNFWWVEQKSISENGAKIQTAYAFSNPTSSEPNVEIRYRSYSRAALEWSKWAVIQTLPINE